jgi:hypothetical protein
MGKNCQIHKISLHYVVKGIKIFIGMIAILSTSSNGWSPLWGKMKILNKNVAKVGL